MCICVQRINVTSNLHFIKYEKIFLMSIKYVWMLTYTHAYKQDSICDQNDVHTAVEIDNKINYGYGTWEALHIEQKKKIWAWKGFLRSGQMNTSVFIVILRWR